MRSISIFGDFVDLDLVEFSGDSIVKKLIQFYLKCVHI